MKGPSGLVSPSWSLSERGLAHRNRSDFCDLRLRCPSQTTLLGNQRRRPKSEMLGFSQPGRALRRFRTTMSAHASKPSNFRCVSLWFQGCFRNLFVKVYRWMGKKVIMVAFAEDNASNRPRNIFDPKKSTGTLGRLARPTEIASDFREFALRFKGAMESR